jgi:triacylglycerol lipase
MQRRALPGLGLALELPKVAVGVGIEAAWAAAHAVMYPLGLLSRPAARSIRRHNLGGLNPAQRGLVDHGVATAETPILLVHGIVDNHTIFTVLHRALRRRGFATVSSYDYGLLTRDVPAAASLLGAAIEKLAADTGYERIHVIGHSLGGLIARYLVQRLDGDRRIDTLVTLGTPHQGSRWAHVVPTPLVRQLRPGSPLLRELEQPAPGCRTRITAIYSDLDQMLLPTSSGRCDHPDLRARNVLFRGAGHMSLPIHRGVIDEVAATLAGLRAPTTASRVSPAAVA